MGVLAFMFGAGIGLMAAVGKIVVDAKQAREKLEEKENKGKKRRVDASEDAPEELSSAELKAMGTWFNE
jgi:outer membrane usher protein FimD/PapC